MKLRMVVFLLAEKEPFISMFIFCPLQPLSAVLHHHVSANLFYTYLKATVKNLQPHARCHYIYALVFGKVETSSRQQSPKLLQKNKPRCKTPL